MASRRLRKSSNSLARIDGSNVKKRHFVLFYENAERAMEIECSFIKRGLLNGEYCILATSKNIDSITEQLTDFGIDVSHFKKHNLFDIPKIPDPSKNPEGFIREMKGMRDGLKRRSDLPKRIVGRYKGMRSESDVNVNIVMEKFIHSDFANLDGSWLCTYHVKRVLLKERAQWMMEMLKNHHVAIFVDRSGQSQVIEM